MKAASAPGGVPPLGGAATASPPHAGADGAEEESISVAAGEFERARRAILLRAIPATGGRKFINGPPKVRLLALIEEHGIEAVVVAVERVPAETYLVPMFVDTLADLLDGAGDELPAVVVDERRQKITQRITALRNQHAAWSAAGEEEERLALIVEEIAGCENELQQLEAEGAA